MRSLFAKSKSDARAREGSVDADAARVAAAVHDPKAFGVLFDAYWDDIFKYCYYHCGDWHTAEDAASEVFVKALANLRNFDPSTPGTTFRAWLYGIARNVVVSGYRQTAKQRQESLDGQPELASSEQSTEELFLAAEQHDELRALLERLPDDQRQLLELRMAGLNAAEIARTLGRSHDAVRKAQSRAVIGLRTALQQQRQISESVNEQRNG
jgi:RNA polymerase sigma-70 factor (ECF subfamily)